MKTGVQHPAGLFVLGAVELRVAAADRHGRFQRIPQSNRVEVNLGGDRLEIVSGAVFASADRHGVVGVDSGAAADSLHMPVEVPLHRLQGLAVHQPPVDGLVEELIGGAEVLADLVGLGDDVGQELEIVVLVTNEVVDGDVAGLTVAIEATVALLKLGGVPGAVGDVPFSVEKGEAGIAGF